MLIAGVTSTGATVVFQADGQLTEHTVSHLRAGIGGINSKSASATSGAATLNKQSGVITSEALTTAGLVDYTLTITNSEALANDIGLASVSNGTNTQGDPVVGSITVTAGTVVIKVRNAHATQALNGTIKISYVLFRI